MEFGDGKLPPKYWERVTVVGDCWIWKTKTLRYYDATIGHWRNARRWMYHQAVRFVTSEVYVTCGNRQCVNPAHLKCPPSDVWYQR